MGNTVSKKSFMEFEPSKYYEDRWEKQIKKILKVEVSYEELDEVPEEEVDSGEKRTVEETENNHYNKMLMKEAEVKENQDKIKNILLFFFFMLCPFFMLFFSLRSLLLVYLIIRHLLNKL